VHGKPATKVENDYDPRAGDWVTAQSRYDAVAGQLRFRGVDVRDSSPDVAWALLLELLDEVSEDLVHFVGAGPLQSFIDVHGAAFADRLEAAARENERFRAAVLEVNLESGHLPPAVESRLVAAFGPRFELLPGQRPDGDGMAADPRERADA
jgi:hypothetical protein